MRYRDLPAVHFTPNAYANLPVPDEATVGTISISPSGKATWTAHRSDRPSLIFAEDGTVIPLHPSEKIGISFPLVQQFRDGRWLVIEARTDPVTPNAFVFDADFRLLRAFYLGDGIQAVLVGQNNRIWVGYFDEGIFGAFNPQPPKGHMSYRYGPSGLLRCDDNGKIEFSYNTQHPSKPIGDIGALTLDETGTAWFCPDTDFLASVSGDHVDYALPKAPVAMAEAISVSRDYIAFFGGYQKSSMVAVMHRASQRLRLVQLHRPDGDTLSPIRIATRGTRAIAVADNRLFRLDQQVLLDALGPWTGANTSDVESAVQYLNEEESYSPYYVIYRGSTAKKSPGKPRPPENQPRKDEDTGQQEP